MIKKLIITNIKIFSILTAVAACFYLLVRITLFNFSSYALLDQIFALALILGEGFVLIHTIGYMIEVYKIAKKGKSRWPKTTDFNKNNAPTVAVIIAARHEKKDILGQTLTTISNLDYPNKNIYLLDDSSKGVFKKGADELGEEFQITVIRREERHGAKAGAINDFLKSATEKYIAVFDADQNPMPDFLKQTIPILEKSEKIGFVQTPQYYSNPSSSPISEGATFQQAIFYEIICEGKNTNNAMFCCGTNVVFRRDALNAVGGFDESSITEDFATSIKIHLKGYQSVYYNHVLVFGMAPETLSGYFKQQTRWAAGTVSVGVKAIGYFFSNPFKLRIGQWWEYFLSGTYYFMGLAFFIFMVCPIAFLLFNIPSFFLLPQIYLSVFIPYMVLASLMFYATMSERHYSARQVYLGSIMGNLSFPILMKAVFLGLIGKKMQFVTTAKGKSDTLPFWSLWPYHVMILLNGFAIGFGIGRLYAEHLYIYAIAINIFWALYHTFILIHIYYFNIEPKLIKPIEA